MCCYQGTQVPLYAIKHLVVSVNGTLADLALQGDNAAPFYGKPEAVGSCKQQAAPMT